MTTPRRFSPGAYGFRLEGLDGASAALVDAPRRWPRLSIVRAADGDRPDTESVTEDYARLWLSGGAWAEIDREAAQADVRVPAGTSDKALVHPYLAPVALVMSRWLGREGFHGGAILADGGVWAVLGEKTAGKSTMLAWLARRGTPVMSDDVLVIDGSCVFAGPRSIDLRADAAEHLGAGDPLGHLGARERWRLPLAPVPAEAPLRGWITLAWGDRVAVEPLRGAERLRALIPHRGVRLMPSDPGALLRLTELPHLSLTRPRSWASLDAAADRLLESIAT
jgi:hypothetical protein